MENTVLTLDQQQVDDACPHCGDMYAVLRGSAYEDGVPFALYLIALHGHDETNQRVAHLAVAIRASDGSKEAVAIALIGASDRMGFNFIDWDLSPWRGEQYLGTMIGREDALLSTQKSRFLHVAEHVVRDLPAVEEYLAP